MKRLLATTMLAAMVALPAFAQGGTPIFTGEKQHQPVTSKNGYFVASPGQLLTSDFIGQPVYNGPSDDADNIGTVNDIILGADGTPQAIVIGVGGFLGVGEKDVAIGCNHFSWVDKSGGTRWLMVDADKEQFEKRPFSTAMQLSPPMAHRAPPKKQ
ncbi:PRC-barrel domain-containing protein [Brucella melitensis]|uniref:PRC-barrel domain-containing protein n=1 Tax=Brucella melitensis TaxID=29459 RepID=UPI0030EC99BC